MTALPSLTPREDRVFGFLESYLERKGYAPALRDISLACGLNSTSSVAYVLEKLEGKGYITRDFATARGIKVVPPPGTDEGRDRLIFRLANVLNSIGDAGGSVVFNGGEVDVHWDDEVAS